MSVLIGNGGRVLDVAFHRDVSIRPVIITGVICWVDIRTPGGAYKVPVLSAFNGQFQSARAPADDEAAPADPLGDPDASSH
eukprot:1876302-Pyramimonas_sp.AAC.1